MYSDINIKGMFYCNKRFNLERSKTKSDLSAS